LEIAIQNITGKINMRIIYLTFFILLANFSFASQVLVIVDGKAITSTDIKKRVKALQLVNPGFIADPDTERQLLNNLVSEELFHNEAARLKFTIKDSEVISRFKEIQQDNNFSDTYTKSLMDNKSLWTQVESQLLWSKLVGAVFYNKTKISGAEIRDEQKIRNKEIKEITFKQILFKGYEAEKIEKIRQEAKNCDDLTLLAKTYSLQKPYYNNLPFSDLNPELQALIKSLEVNKTSEIVQLNGQNQIIMICNKVTVNNPQDVKAIHQELTSKKINAEAQKYLLELKKRIYVEYVVPTE
jgi:hypothetical protein